MTLNDYLRLRHPTVNALTFAEAKLLGIKYPLQKGWVSVFGKYEIAEDLIERLHEARENRYNSDKYQKAKNKSKAKGAKSIAKAIDWSTPNAFIQN